MASISILFWEKLKELSELQNALPEVAACLKDGLWTTEAEKKLLQTRGAG